MTGTGTENDPFVVANWEDFVSIDTVNKVYVKWQDIKDKVIDFNEIKPEGFTEKLFLPRYIDFNGWTLKNFHANHASYVLSGRSSSEPSYIKNLIFENFYALGTERMFFGTNLENCIISGIFNTNSNCETASYSNITNCSFNIRMVTTKQFTFFRGASNKIKNSDVTMDVSAKTSYLMTGDSCNAYNCRFSGKIETTSGVLYMLGELANVYNFATTALLHYGGSGISVYNSDFAGVASGCSANLKPCTSDELKSPEFLYNLGFPIGVD